MRNDKFFRRNKTKQEGYTIAENSGMRPTRGDVGIELEMEGNKFPKNPEYLPPAWSYHTDGSLRGADNAEYVLRVPANFSEVPSLVMSLWSALDSFGTVLDDSNRTSVHVHLNAQGFHANRLCSFAALYLSVEEILTEWCGEARVGNLFCLRAIDAPYIVTMLKALVQEKMGIGSLPDSMKYGGLNLYALAKFGSLEIRTMRGVPDPDVIIMWVAILERLYKLSEEYPDPRRICDNFSGHGTMAYLESVLGEFTAPVVNNIEWNQSQLDSALYRGIRIAQDVCYCRDWDVFEPIVTVIDPFGRKKPKAKTGIFGDLQQAVNNQMAQSIIYTQPMSINTTQGSPQSAGTVTSLDIETYATISPPPTVPVWHPFNNLTHAHDYFSALSDDQIEGLAPNIFEQYLAVMEAWQDAQDDEEDEDNEEYPG